MRRGKTRTLGRIRTVDTQALLEEINAVLPPVPKPEGTAISFHESGCSHCEYLRNDLAQYTDSELSNEDIRSLHQEMSCLSARGWRWVLPSYLRRCLTQDLYDPVETEFLIYNLGPSEEHDAETRERLALLSQQQVACLGNFLEWCRAHPHWSEYCGNDIERARVFIRSVLDTRDAA
jgi:hypothetical protein